MATISGMSIAARSVADRDARFFFAMACVIAGVIVTGFSANVLTGRVTFAAQAWYAHVHAFVFFGWTALFLLQSGLVASGNVALHRRLGWLSLAWVPAMVVMGLVLTISAVRHKLPPPDAPPIVMILLGNVIQILTFAVLVFVALALRRRTAAHRRLMVIASSMLITQALGRLVPMFGAPGPSIGPIIVTIVLGFSVAGAVHDKRLYGRVHPAWWVGMAIQPAFLAAVMLLPTLPIGNALLHLMLDGSPGAAHIPPLP